MERAGWGEEIGRARAEAEGQVRCVEGTGGRLDLDNGSSESIRGGSGEGVYILEIINRSC